MQWNVNLDPAYIGVDQPIGFYCPNFDLDVLRRYRQAMTAQAQRIGAAARSAYQAPSLAPLPLPDERTHGPLLAAHGDIHYQQAVEVDRATFGGPCTLRPWQIIDHAVAVIDQLRWYRNLGGSGAWCTYHLAPFERALTGSLFTMGTHLWVVGRLLRDELCTRAFLGEYAIEWTDCLIRYVRDRREVCARSGGGKPLDEMSALQGFHSGYPPPVDRVFLEIQRLMNELLLPFQATVEAIAKTGMTATTNASGRMLR